MMLLLLAARFLDSRNGAYLFVIIRDLRMITDGASFICTVLGKNPSARKNYSFWNSNRRPQSSKVASLDFYAQDPCCATYMFFKLKKLPFAPYTVGSVCLAYDSKFILLYCRNVPFRPMLHSQESERVCWNWFNPMFAEFKKSHTA